MSSAKQPLSPTVTLTLERLVEDLASDIALCLFEARRDEWEFSQTKTQRISDVHVKGNLKIFSSDKDEPIHEITCEATGKHPYPRLSPKDFTRVGVFGKEALRIAQTAMGSLGPKDKASVKFAITIEEKGEPSTSRSFLATASSDDNGKPLLRFNRTSPRARFGKGDDATVAPPPAA